MAAKTKSNVAKSAKKQSLSPQLKIWFGVLLVAVIVAVGVLVVYYSNASGPAQYVDKDGASHICAYNVGTLHCTSNGKSLFFIPAPQKFGGGSTWICRTSNNSIESYAGTLYACPINE